MFDTYQLPRVILRNKRVNGRNSITTEEVRLDGQVYAKEVPRPDRKIYPICSEAPTFKWHKTFEDITKQYQYLSDIVML